MVYTETPTTIRLERRARIDHGMDLAIVLSPDNTAGRYFIVGVDGQMLTTWRSLGWTYSEAIETIDWVANGPVF